VDHIYERCTQADMGTCSGCRPDSGMDCRYDCLSVCKVCGGMEGSLLPECPGRWLTREEDEMNYRHYCDGTGPFAEKP